MKGRSDLGYFRVPRWTVLLRDAKRAEAWQRTLKQIPTAIGRERFIDGYNDPRYSVLGDHLYRPVRQKKQKE